MIVILYQFNCLFINIIVLYAPFIINIGIYAQIIVSYCGPLLPNRTPIEEGDRHK